MSQYCKISLNKNLAFFFSSHNFLTKFKLILQSSGDTHDISAILLTKFSFFPTILSQISNFLKWSFDKIQIFSQSFEKICVILAILWQNLYFSTILCQNCFIPILWWNWLFLLWKIDETVFRQPFVKFVRFIFFSEEVALVRNGKKQKIVDLLLPFSINFYYASKIFNRKRQTKSTASSWTVWEIHWTL